MKKKLGKQGEVIQCTPDRLSIVIGGKGKQKSSISEDINKIDFDIHMLEFMSPEMSLHQSLCPWPLIAISNELEFCEFQFPCKWVIKTLNTKKTSNRKLITQFDNAVKCKGIMSERPRTFI